MARKAQRTGVIDRTDQPKSCWKNRTGQGVMVLGDGGLYDGHIVDGEPNGIGSHKNEFYEYTGMFLKGLPREGIWEPKRDPAMAALGQNLQYADFSTSVALLQDAVVEQKLNAADVLQLATSMGESVPVALAVAATFVKRFDAPIDALYSGKTLLMWAASQGHLNAAKALLALGADVNRETDDGKTAMTFLRGYWNASEIAMEMINHKMPVDRANPNGCTALMLACNRNDATAVEQLLKLNANPQLRSNDGRTALEYALEDSGIRLNYDAAKALFENGNISRDSQTGPLQTTPLMSAADRRSKAALEFARYLLDKGVNIEIKDKNNRTALEHAIGAKNVEIAAELIRRYPACASQKQKNDLLRRALLDHSLNDVNALIDAGADASQVQPWDYEDRELKVSAHLGSVDGLNVNAKDGWGRTALSYAVELGRADLVVRLLRCGADPRITSAEGKIAADYINGGASPKNFAIAAMLAAEVLSPAKK